MARAVRVVEDGEEAGLSLKVMVRCSWIFDWRVHGFICSSYAGWPQVCVRTRYSGQKRRGVELKRLLQYDGHLSSSSWSLV